MAPAIFLLWGPLQLREEAPKMLATPYSLKVI